MSTYYLIPVTSRNIRIDGKTLFEILGIVDKELYTRELTRIDLTYERKESKLLNESGYIAGFNEYSSILYRIKTLPEKIVIKKDENGLTELFTNIVLECDNESYLNVFKIDFKQVKDIVENVSSYQDMVNNFINKRIKNKKSLFKRKNNVKRGK